MKNQLISPHTHIFLWDLHEVILEKDMRHWIRICLQFNRKWELLRKLNKKSLYIFFTFVLERLKITKKQMVSEELIAAARTTHNDAFIELITTICSSYKPINQTVLLMKELSELGYKHHLGSNIGKTVFDTCMTKFPHIFTIFEAYTIPFNNEKAEIIKKPNPDFFRLHAQKHHKKPEHFIFIDDKKINIHAAQSVGMYTFHFKNAQQLRSELTNSNII